MSAGVIVSYDGTTNDDDALALGQMLAGPGITLSLAYVRHSQEYDPRREEIAQHDAERRLEQGAAWLGDSGLAQHVVVSASTGEGLGQLAAGEQATLIVFGSDYRTPPGHAEPGTTAQQLLDGGSVAIAVAAAGLRLHTDAGVTSVLVSAPESDDAAHRTADALAERLGATIVPPGSEGADLIVVGSQDSAPQGRVSLSGTTRSVLNASRGSVLVVPHGAPVLL